MESLVLPPADAIADSWWIASGYSRSPASNRKERRKEIICIDICAFQPERIKWVWKMHVKCGDTVVQWLRNSNSSRCAWVEDLTTNYFRKFYAQMQADQEQREPPTNQQTRP
jgi:hypothetical protein